MTQRVWPPAFPLDPDARVLPAPLAASLASAGAVAPVILLVAGPHAVCAGAQLGELRGVEDEYASLFARKESLLRQANAAALRANAERFSREAFRRGFLDALRLTLASLSRNDLRDQLPTMSDT